MKKIGKQILQKSTQMRKIILETSFKCGAPAHIGELYQSWIFLLVCIKMF